VSNQCLSGIVCRHLLPSHRPKATHTIRGWGSAFRTAATRNVNLTAPKRRELSYHPNEVFLFRTCSTSQAKLNCWNCKHLLDNVPAFFCNSCKVIQPPEEGASYFKILDCDYTFSLDTQKLQKRYLELQRSLHPDNYSQRSVREREFSESQSALVNRAYRTLLKPLSRGLYMVSKTLSVKLLLSSFSPAGKLTDLTEQIDAALHRGELHAAKALLVQMKYYTNIEEKVKEKLSEFM
uniref:HscB mitochondrial iron-sulfur cluster cochaperone n=1 Tax=Oryzias melastigma TaxID=30732 RepID=A0A3B3DEI0_ORYME